MEKCYLCSQRFICMEGIHNMEEQIIYDLIDAVNACDAERIRALTAANVNFIGPCGERIEGSDAVCDAWEELFARVADYHFEAERLVAMPDGFVVLGCKGGTCIGSGIGSVGGPALRQLPAAWRVVVEAGRIKVWQVFGAVETPFEKTGGMRTNFVSGEARRQDRLAQPFDSKATVERSIPELSSVAAPTPHDPTKSLIDKEARPECYDVHGCPNANSSSAASITQAADASAGSVAASGDSGVADAPMSIHVVPASVQSTSAAPDRGTSAGSVVASGDPGVAQAASTSGAAPVVRTERLLLRPFVEEDADALFACCRNPELGDNAGWKPHETREESQAVLREVFLGKPTVWAVEECASGRLVGSVGLVADPRRENPEALMLGYWLDVEAWGRGLMREAAQAAIAQGFGLPGIATITVCCYPDNLRSKRLIERLGFRFEGTLHAAGRDHRGRMYDLLCYYLPREAWSSADGQSTLRG